MISDAATWAMGVAVEGVAVAVTPHRSTALCWTLTAIQAGTAVPVGAMQLYRQLLPQHRRERQSDCYCRVD